MRDTLLELLGVVEPPQRFRYLEASPAEQRHHDDKCEDPNHHCSACDTDQPSESGRCKFCGERHNLDDNCPATRHSTVDLIDRHPLHPDEVGMLILKHAADHLYERASDLPLVDNHDMQAVDWLDSIRDEKGGQ